MLWLKSPATAFAGIQLPGLLSQHSNL